MQCVSMLLRNSSGSFVEGRGFGAMIGIASAGLTAANTTALLCNLAVHQGKTTPDQTPIPDKQKSKKMTGKLGLHGIWGLHIVPHRWSITWKRTWRMNRKLGLLGGL